MREIEFRGKDLETGEWRFGYLTPFTEKDYQEKKRFTIHWGIVNCAEVDPETIGQFTGRTFDIQKIYEGDAFKDNQGEICIVRWWNLKSRFQLKLLDAIWDEPLSGLFVNDAYKFVGNIHDNPELIPPTQTYKND